MATNLISIPPLSGVTKRSIHSKGISRPLWEPYLSRKEHSLFFLRIIKETLNSLIERNYTHFDAQTTSNCCHGLSILVRELILFLQPMQSELNACLQLESELTPDLLNSLPGELIDLSSLYILTLIIEIDPIRGRRTTPLKLQSKGKLGTSFCEKIVKKLQRSFSTHIAERYKYFCEDIYDKKWISFSTIQDWIRFIENPYLRVDKKGVKYASCMYSMQVSLWHLTRTQATIALVNDLMDPYSKQIKGRYIKLLRNMGKGNISLLDDHSLVAENEPIIVFGGYTFSKKLEMQQLSMKMEPWIHQFSSLVLACDIHYPQFPLVSDDPDFDSTPINPMEGPLTDIIQAHSKVKGVSAEDPSFFCLSHIFVANRNALIHAKEFSDTEFLPSCYIPCPATTKYLETVCSKS